LLNDILSKQFHKGHLLIPLIAVLGAAYIQYSSISENVFLGFNHARCHLLCWSSCLQVFIKSTPELESTPKHTIFGLFLLVRF
jgi:hypothetical protein